MNVHHDLLRQGVPMHQGLINQNFLSQQPQQGQQPTPHNMALLQNSQGANPGLGGIMGGQQGGPNNYQLNMQANGPGRMFMTPNGHSMNLPGGAGPSSHMAGLAPNQLNAFSGGTMMPRRVPSQMPSGMPGMIGGGMPVNMRPNMPMRQPPQQQHPQHQLQHQQQQQHGVGMSADMGLPMNRLPPHARTPSGQLMPTLTQQSMQQPMQHGAFGNPMSLPHGQSHLGSSPLVGSSRQQGGTIAGNQMPPQASVNRSQMTPDNNMFMNFQNSSIQPPLPHGVGRIPNNNSQFGIAPSRSPGDMSQRGSASMNPSGPTTQSLMTPAQVLDHIHTGNDFPTGSYGMGQPPVAPPPRPPSHNHNGSHNPFPMSQSQPSLPPPQHSPRQADRLPATMHPGPSALQRPQSQPQVHHRQSPIPPSRTPRVSQPSLPMHSGGMLPPARVPTAGPAQSPQGSQQPVQQPPNVAPSTHSLQVASRPPTAAPTISGPMGSTPATSAAPPVRQQSAAPEGGPPTQPSASAPVLTSAPSAPSRQIMYPLGFGQGAVRLLQLSGALSTESKERLKMSYWVNLVQTYFTEKATMKLTLWKDNQQVEAKPFEIGFPIFPRFFLVTSQSGVKSQTITIDGARERITSNSHALIECATAAWTFRYTNGYSITLRGPFTAEIVVHPFPTPQPQSATGVVPYILKIERLQFDAFWHDKFLACDSIHGERIPDSPRLMPPSPGNGTNLNGVAADGSQAYDPNRFDEPRYLIDHAIIPAEPINAFGIPQATMRCLELAESVAQMSDLIQFSVNNALGPVDALSAFAEKIRAERVGNRGLGIMEGIVTAGAGSSSYPDGLNGTALMSGHSGSFSIAPNPSQAASSAEQQNAAHPDGASKQAKAALAAAQQPTATTPSAQAATPASAPTPTAGGSTTPSMSHASLKRKAPTGSSGGSPTTSSADPQPAAKRVNRKQRGSRTSVPGQGS